MNRRLIITALIVAALAGYIQIAPFQKEVPLKKAFEELPVKWKGWSGHEMFFNDVILDKLRVSEYIMRRYEKDGDRIHIYIGYYDTQKKGSQIHSPKHCLPGSGWFNLSESIRTLNVEGVGDVDFVESVYQKGDEKEVFYYWYKMKNVYITDEYVLKLYMILNSLRYSRNDAAFLRLSSPIVSNVEDTRKSIEDFMKDVLPLLQDYLPD